LARISPAVSISNGSGLCKKKKEKDKKEKR
jgi:hypothetical protein